MNPQLNTQLRHLRLSGLAEALPVRLEQARAAGLDPMEFLELLVQDELARRADRLFARRLKQAGIIQVKELSDFDWSFNPKIPRQRLCELVSARFVAEHRGALLVGPPGVGKSHAVTAIAIGAIRSGYRAILRNVFDLAQDFAEAEALGERRDLVQKLTKVDLLVLEDFGMKKLGPAAAEDLLEIFVRRHETASTVVTTNRPTEDWGQFLGDVPAATAILDRFLAHAEILPMQGRSYRLHQRARRGACTEDAQPHDSLDASSKPTGAAEEPDPAAPAKTRRPSRRTR
jgi:DNA replication protein DnaC